MAEEFKVGDVVKLKSGGPSMTVDAVEGSFVSCFWFDRTAEGIHQKGTVKLHRDMLSKVPSEV